MTLQVKGYHRESLEECSMNQIPTTRYRCDNLEELIESIEKYWYLVTSVGIEDMYGIELFLGDLVEDDEGRLFEIGYCFDYKEPLDRKQFGRNEMKCIKSSDKYKEDHIKVGRKFPFVDLMYPTNMLKRVGNIYQNKDLTKCPISF